MNYYKFIYKLKGEDEKSYMVAAEKPLACYIDDFEKNFPEREYFRVEKENG